MTRAAVTLAALIAAAPASAAPTDCYSLIAVPQSARAWQPAPPRDGSPIRPAVTDAEKRAIADWYARNRPVGAVHLRVLEHCPMSWIPGHTINVTGAPDQPAPTWHTGPILLAAYLPPGAHQVDAPGAAAVVIGLAVMLAARWRRC